MTPGLAEAPISEDQATRKAARFLEGTDYADSYPDALSRIKDTRLQTEGSNACGPLSGPVWAFHITDPHEGWLYLDARTGEKECSSLPFLR